MAGATDADAGLVSGVFNTAQQVGGALGLALLTTLAAARTATSPAPETAQALTSGYHLAWAAGAVLGAAAIAIAAIALRSPRRGQRDVTRLAAEAAPVGPSADVQLAPFGLITARKPQMGSHQAEAGRPTPLEPGPWSRA